MASIKINPDIQMQNANNFIANLGNGLIESGSSNKGYYWRFANGLQVCYITCNTQADSNNFQVWYYPKLFAITPFVYATAIKTIGKLGSNNQIVPVIYNSTTEGTSWNFFHYGSVTGGTGLIWGTDTENNKINNLTAVAIGYWK